MSKYYCNECDEFFDEPEHVTEEQTLDSHGPKTVDVGYNVCPHCGSEFYEEASECVICGEFPVEYSDGVCEKCLEEIAGNDKCINYLLTRKESRDITVPFILDEFFIDSEIIEIMQREFDECRRLNPTLFKSKLVKILRETDAASAYHTQLEILLKGGDTVDE